jgi:hypothetical protein
MGIFRGFSRNLQEACVVHDGSASGHGDLDLRPRITAGVVATSLSNPFMNP